MNLEDRGIPGGYVASEEFREATAAQAKSLGFYPNVVYIPHPIQNRSDEEMKILSSNATLEIIKLISSEKN